GLGEGEPDAWQGEAELLPNRPQILISPKFPIVLILGFLPVAERSRVPRLALARDFQRIPKKILVPKSKNPLPSAKVILASQIVWAAAGMGAEFYCLTDRSQY